MGIIDSSTTHRYPDPDAQRFPRPLTCLVWTGVRHVPDCVFIPPTAQKIRTMIQGTVRLGYIRPGKILFRTGKGARRVERKTMYTSHAPTEAEAYTCVYIFKYKKNLKCETYGLRKLNRSAFPPMGCQEAGKQDMSMCSARLLCALKSD